MEPGQQEKSKQPKASAYFIAGTISFFVMAIFWSVDSSIVYIFLGSGLVCFFTGFWVSRPKTRVPLTDYRQFHRRPPAPASVVPAHDIQTPSVEKKNQPPAGTANQLPATRKAVLLVVIGMIGLTFVFFIATLFSGDDNQAMAEYYFQQGNTFYDTEQYDSAYRAFKKAMDLNPEYAEAITGYANTLYMRQEVDSALLMYANARKINPYYYLAWYNEAWIYHQQQKFDKSRAELKKLLAENPTYYDAMHLMGDTFYAQKQYDSAMVWYEDAYDNGLRGSLLCYTMGYLYDTKGKTDKAIELYTVAIYYDTTLVGAYKRLGELVPGEKGLRYRNKAAALQTN